MNRSIVEGASVREDLAGVIAHGIGAHGIGERGVGDDVLGAIWARAVWSLVAEPGDGVAGALVAACGPLEALRVAEGATADPSTGLDARAVDEGRRRWQPRMASPAIRGMFGEARRHALALLTPESPGWPHALDDLGVHGPLCLWVRGRSDATGSDRPAIALVGARAASSYGDHVAMDFAAELVGRGVTVVSGAAYGIDGAAHRAALAAGGTTVAVLAGGVDRPYPAGHTQMLDQIASSGAVLSEVAPGGAPTKWRFLQRNRLIAALGDATVVVEAGWRSGSLNTAGHAAALGRPLGAVPGSITSASSAGCHRLLREFDARCITSVDDVMELIGGMGGPDRTRNPPGVTARATDDATRVLDALSTRSPRTPSDVARRAGLAPGDAESLLGLLALEGAAVRDARGWRRAVSAGAAG